MHNLKDIVANYSHVGSNSARLKLLFETALNGFKQPEVAEHIAEVGDLANFHVLRWIRNEMAADREGSRILTEKPRVTKESLQFEKLRDYPAGSLGKEYFDYMFANSFDPSKRPVAKYIPDLELAYIMQRYRETHDFFHVLLGLASPSLLNELGVKVFEGLNLKLPSSSLMGLSGVAMLKPEQRITFLTSFVPQIQKQSSRNKMVLNYFFEENLEKPLEEVRSDLRITEIKI